MSSLRLSLCCGRAWRRAAAKAGTDRSWLDVGNSSPNLRDIKKVSSPSNKVTLHTKQHNGVLEAVDQRQRCKRKARKLFAQGLGLKIKTYRQCARGNLEAQTKIALACKAWRCSKVQVAHLQILHKQEEKARVHGKGTKYSNPEQHHSSRHCKAKRSKERQKVRR